MSGHEVRLNKRRSNMTTSKAKKELRAADLRNEREEAAYQLSKLADALGVLLFRLIAEVEREPRQ